MPEPQVGRGPSGKRSSGKGSKAKAHQQGARVALGPQGAKGSSAEQQNSSWGHRAVCHQGPSE